MAAAGHDAGTASLFVVEGLASYLPVEVLEATLAQLRVLAGPASRLGISIGFTRTEGASPERVAAFREAVAAIGEPIRSELTVEEFDELLERTGWRRATRVAADEAPDIDPERRRRQLALVVAVRAGS